MSVILEQNQRDELLDGLGELFKKIRNHISTPQGRGQVLERLIKAFLKEDPLLRNSSNRYGYGQMVWPLVVVVDQRWKIKEQEEKNEFKIAITVLDS